MDQITYANPFGDVILRKDAKVVELRWHDTTAQMDSAAFDAMLVPFVEAIEASGSTRAMVDVTAFAMPSGGTGSGFRDQEILPRYHQAGLTHFAFVFPKGAPPTQ